jgi:hypothetical protein
MQCIYTGTQECYTVKNIKLYNIHIGIYQIPIQKVVAQIQTRRR